MQMDTWPAGTQQAWCGEIVHFFDSFARRVLFEKYLVARQQHY